MTLKHDRIVGIIAAVIIAVVLIGEVVVYTSTTDRYDVDARYSDDGIDYSVSVSGSKNFSVIAMDNGNMLPISEIYIYFDKEYASDYKSEDVPIGSHELDQEYYIDQLIKSLDYRGAVPIRILSADELAAAMNNDVNGTFQKGLVVLSGALPDTIYGGDNGDIIFSWLDAGGRLYWAGNLLGKYIATKDGIIEVGSEYQKLFFGEDCLNTGGLDSVFDDVTDNDLRYDLSLSNNSVLYGVDVSKLSGDTLSVGYTGEGYSSIALVGYGDGMICVLAGDYSREQRSDLTQIISSGICHTTKVIGSDSGSVRYGAANGTIEIPDEHGNIAVYIYLGGYYPVFGRLFSFV